MKAASSLAIILLLFIATTCAAPVPNAAKTTEAVPPYQVANAADAGEATVISADSAPFPTCLPLQKGGFDPNRTTQAFFPAVVTNKNGKASTLLVPQSAEAANFRVVPFDNGSGGGAPLPSAGGKPMVQGFFQATETGTNGEVINVTAPDSGGRMAPAIGLDGKPIMMTGKSGVKVQIFIPAPGSSVVPAEVSGLNGSKPDLQASVVPVDCQLQK